MSVEEQAIITGPDRERRQPEINRPGRGGVLPPPDRRWKPGQSGNPAGRPQGSRNSFEVAMRRELARRVAGDPILDGNRRVSRRTRLVRALLDRAEAGDTRAAALLLDRIWPLQASGQNHTEPVVVVFDDQDRREFEAATGN